MNRFVEIAIEAQTLANSRGGDYAALTHDELCQFMVKYDEALAERDEQSVAAEDKNGR